jgi:hypothetical protein
MFPFFMLKYRLHIGYDTVPTSSKMAAKPSENGKQLLRQSEKQSFSLCVAPQWEQRAGIANGGSVRSEGASRPSWRYSLPRCIHLLITDTFARAKQARDAKQAYGIPRSC